MYVCEYVCERVVLWCGVVGVWVGVCVRERTIDRGRERRRRKGMVVLKQTVSPRKQTKILLVALVSRRSSRCTGIGSRYLANGSFRLITSTQWHRYRSVRRERQTQVAVRAALPTKMNSSWTPRNSPCSNPGFYASKIIDNKCTISLALDLCKTIGTRWTANNFLTLRHRVFKCRWIQLQLVT